MLDHAERRRILEQPPRKHFVPGQRLIGAFTPFDEHLYKRPGFGRAFPRQRAFAGRQFDDHVADPFGLTHFEHHVLRQVVALVEQAQRGDAVFDRGAVFAFDHFGVRAGAGKRFGDFGRHRLGRVIRAATTG